MPIRPENRDRYPKDWPEIRQRILVRAKDRCERCGAPNGADIARGIAGDAGTYMIENGNVYCERTGEHLGRARGSEYASRPLVRIVLTIAHLDHTPENCDPTNLQALCQLCHNRLDAPMRRAGIRARRRAGAAIRDIFTEN